MTRDEAKALGLKHYITGVPCKFGHHAPRYVSSQHCIQCQKRRSKEYSDTAASKVRSKLYHIGRAYGLTAPEFFTLWEAQGRSCAICHDALELRGACIDHNHATKEVRGILCVRCNSGFGSLREDPIILRSAALYAERYNKE